MVFVATAFDTDNSTQDDDNVGSHDSCQIAE